MNDEKELAAAISNLKMAKLGVSDMGGRLQRAKADRICANQKVQDRHHDLVAAQKRQTTANMILRRVIDRISNPGPLRSSGDILGNDSGGAAGC